MPALFDRHVHAPTRRHHRRTVAVSVVVHVAVLLVLVVSQLSAALQGLDVNRRLEMVSLPAAPPPPPVPESPRPPSARNDVAVNPDAAPVESNDIVLDGPPPVPPTAGSPAPDAFATGEFGWTGVGSAVDSADVSLSAPPARQAPVRPGGDIEAPTRTHFVSPDYPDVARTARIEGTVILEAIIDEAGRVRNVRVLRSIPLLDRAAMDAVRQWRYTPTRLNGVPVPVVMTVTVTFTMR